MSAQPQTKEKSSPWPLVWTTLGTLVVLTLYTFFTLDTKNVNLLEASGKALGDLGTMFFSPMPSSISWGEGVLQILRTLGLALLTTVIGTVVSFFLALPASRNLGHPFFGAVIKYFVALVRAVPTVLWVLIFALSAGLGSAAAIIGMTFHTVGYLIKAFSESFEEMDSGTLEALKASGANWWHIVFQAVLPSSLTYMLSWVFIRFEINFTVAVAMGAAAGAGGIGFDLFQSSAMYFDLREVGFITYLILAVAMGLEFLATRLKARTLKYR